MGATPSTVESHEIFHAAGQRVALRCVVAESGTLMPGYSAHCQGCAACVMSLSPWHPGPHAYSSLCLRAVQREHNLPPARPEVAAVPLVAYARNASEHNALFVARQLQRAVPPPRQLSPAPAAVADARAGHAAAERRVASELAAVYAEDVIPFFASEGRGLYSMPEERSPHAVRMLRRRRSACLSGAPGGEMAPCAEAGALHRAPARRPMARRRMLMPPWPGRRCRTPTPFRTRATRSCRWARTTGAPCSCCPGSGAGR